MVLGTTFGDGVCLSTTCFEGECLSTNFGPMGSGGVQSFFSSPGSRLILLKCSGSFALLKCAVLSVGFGRASTVLTGTCGFRAGGGM